MEKDFVNYEIALELKELGFEEPCWCYFIGDVFNTSMFLKDYEYLDTMPQKCITYTLAPLRQQAFRWFREKYDINNGICYSRLENNDWYYQYYKSALIGGFKTYEEAELACLKKLIEICRELK